jgi:hypothetical protein
MGPMAGASRLGEKLFVCFILIAETVNDSFLSGYGFSLNLLNLVSVW